MMKMTGLSHLFNWEHLHNWWLTKYFFAPLYLMFNHYSDIKDRKFSKWSYTNGEI